MRPLECHEDRGIFAARGLDVAVVVVVVIVEVVIVVVVVVGGGGVVATAAATPVGDPTCARQTDYYFCIFCCFHASIQKL